MKPLATLTFCIFFAALDMAVADEHVEVRYGNVYVNVYIPGTIEEQGVAGALYGPHGLVAGILAGAIQRSKTADDVDVTLVLSSKDEVDGEPNSAAMTNDVVVSVLWPNGHPLADEVVTIDSPANVVAARFCDLILDTNCESTEILNDFAVMSPREENVVAGDIGAGGSGALPNINFGSPGSISEGSFFLVPPANNLGLPADLEPPAELDDNLFDLAPIQEALEEQASSMEPSGIDLSNDGQDGPNADVANDSVNDPVHWFVVHCTAFSASDIAVAKAVANLRATGKKNKAYSWIDSKGRELVVVDDLKNPGELATRTESTPYCPSIARQARARYINLEIHYACSEQGGAAPTSAQYKAIPQFYKKAASIYGPMHVTSHRHVDRGIKGAHTDPSPGTFSFDRLKREFAVAGIDTSKIFFLTSEQQSKPAYSEHKHFYTPDRQVSLKKGADDCR